MLELSFALTFTFHFKLYLFLLTWQLLLHLLHRHRHASPDTNHLSAPSGTHFPCSVLEQLLRCWKLMLCALYLNFGLPQIKNSGVGTIQLNYQWDLS